MDVRQPKQQRSQRQQFCISGESSPLLNECAISIPSFAAEISRQGGGENHHAVASTAASVGEARGGGRGSSLHSAIVGVVKGMVGPAILYLPHAFATTGYVVALPLLLLTTSLFLYSARCLLAVSNCPVSCPPTTRTEMEIMEMEPTSPNTLSCRVVHMIPLSYPQLAYRAFGAKGKRIVEAGIALMQCGVCLTYFIFVSQNLHTSFQALTRDSDEEWGWGFHISSSPQLWILVMIAIEIPLVCLGDIRLLAPINKVANTLILFGISSIVVCALHALRQAVQEEESWRTMVGNVMQPVGPDWSLFMGTSALLFEGSITLVLPLYQSVHTEQRRFFPALYAWVILILVLVYTAFGLLGWLSFGPHVQVVLTMSLPAPHHAVYTTLIQLAYAIAVLLTFPLQLFPAIDIIVAACPFSTTTSSSNTTMTTTNTITTISTNTTAAVVRSRVATALVLVLAGIAWMSVNALATVVALMGSILGCPIAFCIPPLIHNELWVKRRSCNNSMDPKMANNDDDVLFLRSVSDDKPSSSSQSQSMRPNKRLRLSLPLSPPMILLNTSTAAIAPQQHHHHRDVPVGVSRQRTLNWFMAGLGVVATIFSTTSTLLSLKD